MENRTKIAREGDVATGVISSSGDLVGHASFIQREVEEGVNCTSGDSEEIFACLKAVPSFAAVFGEMNKMLAEKNALSRDLKISEERAAKQKKRDEATIRDKQEEIENLKSSLKRCAEEKEGFEQQVRKLEEEKVESGKKFGELQSNLTEERRKLMTYKLECNQRLQNVMGYFAAASTEFESLKKFAFEEESQTANVLPSTPSVYAGINPEIVVAGAEADPRLARAGANESGQQDSSLKELQLSHMQTNGQDGSSRTEAAENLPNGIPASSLYSAARPGMAFGWQSRDPRLWAHNNENGKRASSYTNFAEHLEAVKRVHAADRAQVHCYDQMQRSGEGRSDRTGATENSLKGRRGSARCSRGVGKRGRN